MTFTPEKAEEGKWIYRNNPSNQKSGLNELSDDNPPSYIMNNENR